MAKPPTVVSIPNSRQIPEGANLYYCYIRGEQAHFINLIEAKKLFMDAFERQRDLVRERKGTKTIYDNQKILAGRHAGCGRPLPPDLQPGELLPEPGADFPH